MASPAPVTMASIARGNRSSQMMVFAGPETGVPPPHVPLQDGDDRVQRDFLGAEPEGHDGDDNGQSQQNEGEEKGGNSPAARHGRARNALAAG